MSQGSQPLDSESANLGQVKETWTFRSFKNTRPYLLLTMCVIGLAGPALWRLAAEGAQSDVFLHAVIANQLVTSGQWFTYSIYYPINFTASLGSTDPHILRTSSFLLLLIFTIVKSSIVFYYARKILGSELWSLLVAFIVLCAVPILNPLDLLDVYLGQWSANAWHNSTTLLAGVFAVPTFFSAIDMIKRRRWKDAYGLGLWLSLLTLSKPSFTLVIIPVFVLLFALWSLGRTRRKEVDVWKLCVSIAPPILILAIQYVLTFYIGTGVFEKPTLGFSPFEVWVKFSPNIPFSVVLSLLGPALAWMALSSPRKRDLSVMFAWLLVIVAGVQYALFTEYGVNGEPTFNGNWTWGIIPSMSLLFMISSIQLVLTFRDKFENRIQLFFFGSAWLVLIGHTLSGLYYLFNLGREGFPTFVL